MAVAAPLARGVALTAPAMWTAAAAWVVLTAGLMLADLLLAAPPRRLTLEAAAPRVLGVGRAETARRTAASAGAAPREVELAVGVNERLVAEPDRQVARLAGGRAEADV